MNMSRVQLRFSITIDGKDVRLATGFSSLNPIQRDILPHRQSQLSDLTIRLTLSPNVQTVL